MHSSIERAFKGSFRFSSLFLVFVTLLCISTMRLIAFMLAWENPTWVGFGLFFFVSSLAFPILAAVGVPLIRNYVRMCQGKKVSLITSCKESFDQALASFAVFLTIPCVMLVLWILGAADTFLKMIPIFGDFWQGLFAFVGLTISICRILAMFAGLFALYIFVPEFALSTSTPFQIVDSLFTKSKKLSLQRIKGFFFAIVPILILLVIIALSLATSDALVFDNMGPLWLLSWLSRSLVLCAIFSVFLLNFFNVSAEMLRLERKEV